MYVRRPSQDCRWRRTSLPSAARCRCIVRKEGNDREVSVLGGSLCVAWQQAGGKGTKKFRLQQSVAAQSSFDSTMFGRREQTPTKNMKRRGLADDTFHFAGPHNPHVQASEHAPLAPIPPFARALPTQPHKRRLSLSWPAAFLAKRER